eukprot:3287618-Pleurochrysis_carterae.AAC.3
MELAADRRTGARPSSKATAHVEQISNNGAPERDLRDFEGGATAVKSKTRSDLHKHARRFLGEFVFWGCIR